MEHRDALIENIFYGPRQCGKTTKLLDIIPKDSFLLVHSHREADRIRDNYPDKVRNIKVISWDQYKYWSGTRGRVYIDNADWFLTELLMDKGFDLQGITLTTDKEWDK
jgi:hypothetical protein